MGYMDIKEAIKSDSDNYAAKRKFAYTKMGNKKISTHNFKLEVSIARILGEMQMSERLIALLKKNPEWDGEDIEARLHILVTEANNLASDTMGSDYKIDVEDVLETHGYLN